jgi:hypothetical protein
MHIAILIFTLTNSGGILYLILRKPRQSGGPVSALKPEGHHRICAECGSTVARYTPREDGSVVCANCKPFGA